MESRFALEQGPQQPLDGDHADERERERGGDDEAGYQRGLWLRLERRREEEASKKGRGKEEEEEEEEEYKVLCEQLQVSGKEHKPLKDDLPVRACAW